MLHLKWRHLTLNTDQEEAINRYSLKNLTLMLRQKLKPLILNTDQVLILFNFFNFKIQISNFSLNYIGGGNKQVINNFNN